MQRCFFVDFSDTSRRRSARVKAIFVRQPIPQHCVQPEQDGTRHFGFRDVEKEQKEDLVRGVFDSVADNYDVMNDIMSGTLHRYWKDEFVNTLHPLPGMQIIDVAGGTGDVAFQMHDMIRKKARRDIIEKRGMEDEDGANSSGDKIVVCDINTEMLRVGEDRAIKRGYDVVSNMNFVEGNAENLPLRTTLSTHTPLRLAFVM